MIKMFDTYWASIVFVLLIVYVSMSLGVMIKYNQYGNLEGKALTAFSFPLFHFIAYPIYFLFFKKSTETMREKLWFIGVLFLLFPYMVDLMARQSSKADERKEARSIEDGVKF